MAHHKTSMSNNEPPSIAVPRLASPRLTLALMEAHAAWLDAKNRGVKPWGCRMIANRHGYTRGSLQLQFTWFRQGKIKLNDSAESMASHREIILETEIGRSEICMIEALKAANDALSSYSKQLSHGKLTLTKVLEFRRAVTTLHAASKSIGASLRTKKGVRKVLKSPKAEVVLTPKQTIAHTEALDRIRMREILKGETSEPPADGNP